MSLPPSPQRTAREIVQSYYDRNYRVVYWPQDGDLKGPVNEGWPNERPPISEWNDRKRCGLVLATEVAPGKRLYDVDIDFAAGSKVAQVFLPPTGFIYGRTSKRVSHCFYYAPDIITTRRYEDPVDHACLIELRGAKHDGSAGMQSMVPPSFWSKDGKVEPLVFVCDGDPALVETSSLKSRVVLSAIAMILAKNLGKWGFGHEVRLAWAGFLLRFRSVPPAFGPTDRIAITPEDLITMGEWISEFCDNREVDDVRRVVTSTAAALDNGDKKVSGGPKFARLIGPHAKQILTAIRRWLGQEITAGIEIRPGELPHVVDQAEASLLECGADIPIYQRAGQLVRPVKNDRASRDEDRIQRPAGSTVISVIRESWLLEQMARAAPWYQHDGKGYRRRVDPPPLYSRTLLDRGEWEFPVLRAIVSAPTLARDGRIIERPGYDEASGLLLDFPEDAFPPVPQQPTQAEATAALARLVQPLRAFPFADDAAKSVAVAAILTAVVRRSMRTAPLHAYDAPVAGSGKTILAEIPALLALGVRPSSIGQGGSEEEDQKLLATLLHVADPIILIDNCERQIAGQFLCRMLTSDQVQARILGFSERRELPSLALVLATGNNLQLAGDASRRAVICRLDAKVDRPDTREFDFDVHDEVMNHRASLVIDALTVLRAYVVAKCPNKLTPFGSFPDYDLVRGSLVWLGYADPADTRITILDNDPRRDDLTQVMDLWEICFGAAPTVVADIAVDDPADDLKALQTKLIEVACRGGKWSGKSVGWWLSRHRDRVVSTTEEGAEAPKIRTFRLEKHKTNRGQQWRLEGCAAHPDAGKTEEDVPF